MSTFSETKVTFTGAYRATPVVTETVARTSVGMPSPTGGGPALRPETVRSGGKRGIVAGPKPFSPAFVTPTRTPWLPMSVSAGVLSLFTGADTFIRNRPAESVAPAAVKFVAGMITRTVALVAFVSAWTSKGAPG